MALFLPRRWNRQPQHLVELDISSPFYNGLLDVFTPVSQQPALVTKSTITPGGSYWSYSAGQAGSAFRNTRVTTNDVSNSGFSVSRNYLSLRSTFSGFLLFTPDYAVATDGTGSPAGEQNAAWGYNHVTSTYRNAFHFYDSAYGWTASKFSTPSAATTYLWIVTLANRVITTYTNGVQTDQVTNGARPDSEAASSYFCRNYGGYSWSGGVYLLGYASRAWSAPEVAEFARNPWQLFAPINRRIYFGVTAGGADTTITPSAGTLTLTGNAPTVTQTTNAAITPTTGALAFTGYAPTVGQTTGANITPDVGALTLTGQAPTVTQTTNAAMTPDAGALTLTGYAPSVNTGFSLTPDVGGIVLAGYAPTVTQTTNAAITPSVGALAFTGYAPTVAATGTSIWTNIDPSSTSWSNVAAESTIWTNI